MTALNLDSSVYGEYNILLLAAKPSNNAYGFRHLGNPGPKNGFTVHNIGIVLYMKRDFTGIVQMVLFVINEKFCV